ncbi:MAG: hypothetical protein JW795_12905 [Chitinivibrionales bacterium]|nr:hypothetical protein [Chitinivibrionales bacterium]
MDPISEALTTFQTQLNDFTNNKDKNVLDIIAEGQHGPLLVKIMRSQEWQPENKSPFLIFSAACLKSIGGLNRAFITEIQEHYVHIKKGLESQGVVIPAISEKLVTRRQPIEQIESYVCAFKNGTAPHCAPPFFCWLPTSIKDRSVMEEMLSHLMPALVPQGVRFILAAPQAKFFSFLMKNETAQKKIETVAFSIDEKKGRDYFGRLYAPPSKGHADGTPSGSAAPDVEPPPRPTPGIPESKEAKEFIASLNLPAMLSPRQAQALTSAVICAAMASGRNDPVTAIGRQTEACAICENAGVKLEYALMRLTLANYHLQFKNFDAAIAQYTLAQDIAVQCRAYPQLAQIRMALAFIFMRKKQTWLDALSHYEQAAAAAAIGQSWLLYLESLRMAGTCYLNNEDIKGACACWKAAIDKCAVLSADEIRNSTFLDIAGAYIRVLTDNNLHSQAQAVQSQVQTIGEKFTIAA